MEFINHLKPNFPKLLCQINEEQKKFSSIFPEKFAAHMEESDLWQVMILGKGGVTYKSFVSGVTVKIPFGELQKEQKVRLSALKEKHLSVIDSYKFINIPIEKDFKEKCIDSTKELKNAYINVLQICKYLKNVGFSSNLGQYNVEQKKGAKDAGIRHLLENPAWKKASRRKTGHDLFTHIVTKCYVGLSGHVESLGEGAVVDIATNLQNIINIVADRVLLLPQTQYVKGMEDLQERVDKSNNFSVGRVKNLASYYQKMMGFAALRLVAIRYQGHMV